MKLHHRVIAVFISMLWGMNFVAAKSAVAHFPPFFLLALRMLIVAIVLLPFLQQQKKFRFKKLFFIAVNLTVLHFGLMFAALYMGINVGVAAIIDQLKVPFAAALGFFMFNEHIGKRAIFGMLLALLGTTLIMEVPNVQNNNTGFWLMVLSSLAWAFYNIQVKNFRKIDLVSFIGIIAWIGMPQLFLLSFMLEENHFFILKTASSKDIFSLLYIAIVATIVAHGLWYNMLCEYKVNQVVPYSLLVPVFGVASGIIFLDEKITPELLIGAILTIVGVAIIVLRWPKSIKGGQAT